MSSPAVGLPKPTTMEKIQQILIYEINQNLKHLWHIAPEETQIVSDRFESWANRVLSSYPSLFLEFMCCVTEKELNHLLTSCFTDKNWPVHRRAFFSELLVLIKQKEKEGLFASKDLVSFYRNRYDPQYLFASESSLAEPEK